eukprot:1722841-Pyramimonas_sp.AAC.1
MYPGTAFTRSIGDSAAERIGVCAEPECIVQEVAPEMSYLIIASDGVFEFLSSQAVLDMVRAAIRPLFGCATSVGGSACERHNRTIL